MAVPTYVNPRDQLHQELARQRERIEELEAENAELRERYDPAGVVFPRRWRLTVREHALLAALYKAPQSMSKQQLMNAMYDNDIDEPGLKIIDVFVCKLRKKLAGDGIKITVVWGRGYELEPQVRAAVREAVASASSGAPWVSPLPPAIRPMAGGSRWSLTPAVRRDRERRGAAIRARRLSLGVTPLELAERISTSANYIHIIEAGASGSEKFTLAEEALRDWR